MCHKKRKSSSPSSLIGGYMSLYDLKVLTRDDKEFELKELKGKILLIVNTATGCGFTPQYEGLEKLYKEYHDKGLEIIDIPCNQFGNQAPGTDDEIHEFCALKYNTSFDQFTKADVNGETKTIHVCAKCLKNGKVKRAN
jgi:glutathione peroxidase